VKPAMRSPLFAVIFDRIKARTPDALPTHYFGATAKVGLPL